MQVREITEALVLSEDIEFKLAPLPDDLEDSEPGTPLRIENPGRPGRLHIRPISEAGVPSVEGYHDPDQRGRILHSFANHELQAVELFAWALLAFPGAPADYRRGLLRILQEEPGSEAWAENWVTIPSAAISGTRLRRLPPPCGLSARCR